MRPATFVFAGGGTGGHVLPALAVARVLRARGHTVQFVGVAHGMEAKLVPAENFPIEWIQIGGLKRVGLRKTIATLLDLRPSIFRSIRILRACKPAAVFSTGGYVAGPVLAAAILTGTPIVIMEPNSVPGFTHRRLAGFVYRALVSFPETMQWFPKGRAEVTGMPIRSEFFAIPRKPREELATILITGGSQGSRTVNRAAQESWPLWADSGLKRVRLIHQTGVGMFETLSRGFAGSGLPGEISEFIRDMPRAFAEADLVLSRSGMGTVSELAAAGKPAILVPFPGASDDHQLKNAQAFERAGAAKLILDRDMSGETFVREVVRITMQPGLLESMALAARRFAKPGAAERAAEVLERLAEQLQAKSVV